jgi:AcrR family transcriptional regulator
MDTATVSAKPDIRGKIKQQKTELIQEEIMDAAARLIAERGFRAVTVDDISAEMGFTKSIVYYYMKNKNEILWRIFEKIDETYAKTLDDVINSGGSPAELLALVVKTHSLNVMSHQAWATIYNRDDNELTDEQRETVTANRKRYNKHLHDLYAKGVADGVFRDIPPTVAICCLVGACNWPYTWYKPGFKYTKEQIAEHFAEMLIKGVALK